MATRLDELKRLYFGESGDEANWREIQKIAQTLGISKPEGGWDEAIPLILKAEQAEATKEVAKPPSKRVVSQDPPITPWRKKRTDLYGNLIPNPFE